MTVTDETPITVMHLNASNFYGGPEKQIIEHLKRLTATRFRGIVASFQEGPEVNEIIKKAESEDLISFSIPSSGATDFSAFTGLKNILVENNVDILCTHGFKSTVTGWFASLNLGIPVLAYSRGYTAENRKVAFYEWLERKILKKVDGIISVSHGQKEKLHTYGIKKTKEWVVHNAVSVNNGDEKSEEFRKQFFVDNQLPENALIAVAAGRLSPEKGHKYLIEAVSSLGEAFNNLFFVFAGDGVCREQLEQMAKTLNVQNRCRFIGFRKDITKIFGIMDFLVLPSLTEGLPNVILEAFSHKKPVLSTDVGGVSELVSHLANGVLVPAKKPNLLADGIRKLAESAEFRTELGESGYETVRLNFSFEKQNKELESIYDNISKTV